MSRLTEREPHWLGEEFWVSAREPDEEELDEVYMKLKHYEDLEEQDRLIEQKHGQWKSVDFNKIMCSECNHIWNIMNNEVENFKYCPNCGVKMDKVK